MLELSARDRTVSANLDSSHAWLDLHLVGTEHRRLLPFACFVTLRRSKEQTNESEREHVDDVRVVCWGVIQSDKGLGRQGSWQRMLARRGTAVVWTCH